MILGFNENGNEMQKHIIAHVKYNYWPNSRIFSAWFAQ